MNILALLAKFLAAKISSKVLTAKILILAVAVAIPAIQTKNNS